jgi:hypothetical protein
MNLEFVVSDLNVHVSKFFWYRTDIFRYTVSKELTIFGANINLCSGM